jgi:small subunit ribosomal protein S16
VAVKIRLKRLGKIRAPYYRIVVADSRTKRDGRAIEEIGKYHPTLEPSLIEVDSGRAQYWLGVGAQPTEQVMAILKITGDWQKHKGLPGAEGTLRVAAPKVDKKAVFEAAAKESLGEHAAGATTPKARKKAEPRAEKSKVEEPKVEQPKVEAPDVEAPVAVAPEVEAPVVEAPVVEAPVVEAPVVGAPVVEAPVAQEPVAPLADAADEGAPGGSETSVQTRDAADSAPAEG